MGWQSTPPGWNEIELIVNVLPVNLIREHSVRICGLFSPMVDEWWYGLFQRAIAEHWLIVALERGWFPQHRWVRVQSWRLLSPGYLFSLRKALSHTQLDAVAIQGPLKRSSLTNAISLYSRGRNSPVSYGLSAIAFSQGIVTVAEPLAVWLFQWLT